MSDTLHHIQTAQIIPLFSARPKPGKRILRDRKNSSDPQCEEGISDTAGNQRLRSNRRDVWREADAVMEYWHVSMKMHGAISRVQNFGTPEGELHPIRDPKDYWTLVAKWRQAWARA
jgi:hypothetical protein